MKKKVEPTNDFARGFQAGVQMAIKRIERLKKRAAEERGHYFHTSYEFGEWGFLSRHCKHLLRYLSKLEETPK